jgi:hypothetical protein
MQQRIDSLARYGGLIAVGMEWSALVFFYLRQPMDFTGALPISHFATLPQTRIVFTCFYLVAALSFWLFASRHLSKVYQTPLKLFAFSMLGFAAMAITPFNPADPLSNGLHTLFSHSSFVAFLVGMYLMAKNNEDRRFHGATVAAVVLSAMLMILFRFAPHGSYWLLFFEAGAWFICQLWIIWVSVLAHKRYPHVV